MSYVDGFVIPVPVKNLPAYKRMAKLAGKVWREHGALEYKECIADDVKVGKLTSFPRAVKRKPGDRRVLLDRVQVAGAARSCEREGDERPAHRSDDGCEDAVRRQAPDLRRFQGHSRRLSARQRPRPSRRPLLAGYSRSMIAAIPWPPPMHIVMRP